MNPDLGGKTDLLENTRNLALSLLGAEISRFFERSLGGVISYWKRYEKQALKPRVSQLFFGQQRKLVEAKSPKRMLDSLRYREMLSTKRVILCSSCGTVQLYIIPIDIDTLIPARTKGVDGFNVETSGSGKTPLSPSFGSLTLLGHPLCTNFAIIKPSVDYVMHSSFAYRQFRAISRVVIQRFCRMSSSTAEMVALLFTTCACPVRAKSSMFTRPAS
ncbi:hypothetical protein AVEN_225487-1 [Araneus ventricosus]|uniref:Uncharacterized protein n=1 Tax=Araneus ventricosus TaxID=182803 RepID=A0A4Y2KTQ1_ARAVE|nr:hypothetical protein AVEN_225487-1 [Araneus ventricosus]